MFGIPPVIQPEVQGDGWSVLVAVLALLVVGATLVAFMVWGMREVRREEQEAIDAGADEHVPVPHAA
jgi:hypothetical protein